MIAPFDAFEIHELCILNFMENWVVAQLEQMLHFQELKTLLKFFLNLFQCCLKIENDAMIYWAYMKDYQARNFWSILPKIVVLPTMALKHC